MGGKTTGEERSVRASMSCRGSSGPTPIKSCTTTYSTTVRAYRLPGRLDPDSPWTAVLARITAQADEASLDDGNPFKVSWLDNW